MGPGKPLSYGLLVAPWSPLARGICESPCSLIWGWGQFTKIIFGLEFYVMSWCTQKAHVCKTLSSKEWGGCQSSLNLFAWNSIKYSDLHWKLIFPTLTLMGWRWVESPLTKIIARHLMKWQDLSRRVMFANPSLLMGVDLNLYFCWELNEKSRYAQKVFFAKWPHPQSYSNEVWECWQTWLLHCSGHFIQFLAKIFC